MATSLTFPVMTQTKVIQYRNMHIFYPEVYGLENTTVQQKVNHDIFTLAETLRKEQYIQQDTTAFSEMIGTYEIKTNERHILSLSLSNYAIFFEAANGLTLMDSLTFQMETGKLYTLSELFKQNANYIDVLSKQISQQIKERNIPLLEPFTAIRPDQNFYIADKSLVIYFQLYELSPHYVGFPMFPISVFDLEEIAAPNGPLDIMATNT